MKLVSFEHAGSRGATVGGLIDNVVVDLASASGATLPRSMLEFLAGGDETMSAARRILASAESKIAGDGAAAVTTPDGAPCAYPLDDVVLRSPVPRPGKIIHTACNFVSHLEELTTWQAPEWKAHDWGKFHFDHPTGFLEAPSAVVGTNAAVAIPVFTKQLDYEVELAIVIGRRVHNVSVDQALDFVAGYMVFNDLSARDIQAREHANKVILLGKSFDGSCPLGPWLTTRDEVPDPADLEMKLLVNGELRQSSTTGHMKYKPAELVSWWSHITLEPGDVLTSGSPPGVAAGMKEPKWLKPGDRVDATVGSLGTLTVHITAPEQ